MSASAAIGILAALAAQDGVHVVLWHSYNGVEREALENALGVFEASDPGFTVDVSAVPYDALADKLTAAIPRGHGPDVFIFAHDRIGGWAEGGHIQPIELYVTEALLDEHTTPCVLALAYGSSLYGLPLAHKALALYVRTDRVPAPPASFEELLGIAKAATDPAKGRYGLVYGNIDLFAHTPLLFSLGGTLFEGRDQTKGVPGRVRVVNEGVIRSLQLARRIAKEEGITPDDTSQMAASGMFSDGRVPLVISGPWFRSEIDRGVPYTVVPIPAFPGGQPSSGFSTCEGVMLNARAKHPKEAFALMRFLANDPRSAGLRMTIGGQPVTLLSAWKDALPELSEDQQLIFRAFDEAFRRSTPSPSDPQMAAVWTPMNAALYKSIHLAKDPRACAEEAQARIESALEAGR